MNFVCEKDTHFGGLGAEGYGLSVYVPPISYVEMLTPSCDGIWKGGLWEVIRVI